MLAYAKEIEGEIEKLEAQVVVMEQATAERAQASEPEQSVAALKAPNDPETKG